MVGIDRHFLCNCKSCWFDGLNGYSTSRVSYLPTYLTNPLINFSSSQNPHFSFCSVSGIGKTETKKKKKKTGKWNFFSFSSKEFREVFFFRYNLSFFGAFTRWLYILFWTEFLCCLSWLLQNIVWFFVEAVLKIIII